LMKWTRLMKPLLNKGPNATYGVRLVWEAQSIEEPSPSKMRRQITPDSEGSPEWGEKERLEQAEEIMNMAISTINRIRNPRLGALNNLSTFNLAGAFVGSKQTQSALSAAGSAPWIIHPASKKRFAWSFLSLFTLMYDVITLSIELFQPLRSPFFEAMRWTSSFFWLLDIIVSFLTAVYIDGELHTSLYAIGRRYVRTWFVFDILCTVPPILFASVEDDSAENDFASFVRLLKMLRYSRIIRLTKSIQMIDQLLNMVNSTTLLLAMRCCNEVIAMAFWVHISGSIWYILGTSDTTGWVYEQGFDTSSAVQRYLVSIHWSAAQLQGGTDIFPGTSPGERAYAVVQIFLSVVLLARFVSKLTNVMLELHEIYAEQNQTSTIRNYFERQGVSAELQMKVRAYLEASKRGRTLQRQDKEGSAVLQSLPTAMKRQVIVETRGKHINVNPIMLAIQISSARCFERLSCDALQPTWMHPDEQLFCFGDLCTKMHFVGDGTLAYLKYLGSLHGLCGAPEQEDRGYISRNPSQGFHAGAGFGRQLIIQKDTRTLCEAVLWTNWIHCGDAVSRRYTLIFSLSAADFHALTACYAVVNTIMKQQARLFVDVLNNMDRSLRSDLLDSTSIVAEDEKANPAKKFRRLISVSQSQRMTESKEMEIPDESKASL